MGTIIALIRATLADQLLYWAACLDPDPKIVDVMAERIGQEPCRPTS